MDWPQECTRAETTKFLAGISMATNVEVNIYSDAGIRDKLEMILQVVKMVESQFLGQTWSLTI